MALKWFVSKNETIDGPMSTDDVQSKVQNGSFDGSFMIWGAGMEQWQRLDWWARELPRLATHVHPEPVIEAWHYALNGKSHGPLKRDALIAELKNLNSLNDVMLWTKGMKEWAPLFEFHDILTAVGVNKRLFPRADLQGKVILRDGGSTLVAPLMSISEGGVGLHLENGIEPGQQLSIEIHSEVFHENLQAKAEVRYVAGGVTGLRFTQVSAETKAAIIQFVRQNQPRFVLKAA